MTVKHGGYIRCVTMQKSFMSGHQTNRTSRGGEKVNYENAKTCTSAQSTLAKELKIFNLYLETMDASYPSIAVKVSEYQLIDTIRVLSSVYFIRVTD